MCIGLQTIANTAERNGRTIVILGHVRGPLCIFKRSGLPFAHRNAPSGIRPTIMPLCVNQGGVPRQRRRASPTQYPVGVTSDLFSEIRVVFLSKRIMLYQGIVNRIPTLVKAVMLVRNGLVSIAIIISAPRTELQMPLLTQVAASMIPFQLAPIVLACNDDECEREYRRHSAILHLVWRDIR